MCPACWGARHRYLFLGLSQIKALCAQTSALQQLPSARGDLRLAMALATSLRGLGPRKGDCLDVVTPEGKCPTPEALILPQCWVLRSAGTGWGHSVCERTGGAGGDGLKDLSPCVPRFGLRMPAEGAGGAVGPHYCIQRGALGCPQPTLPFGLVVSSPDQGHACCCSGSFGQV